MVMLHVTSLTFWLQKLKAGSLLAMLVGCTPDSLPPLGSYLDFMGRLWAQSKAPRKPAGRISFQKIRTPNLPKSPEKGKSFLINMTGLPISWPNMPWPMMTSLSIMKKSSSISSALPRSSFPYGTG